MTITWGAVAFVAGLVYSIFVAFGKHPIGISNTDAVVGFIGVCLFLGILLGGITALKINPVHIGRKDP